MPENTYCSLTTAGFITSPTQKAVEAFADYLSTNFSQSNVHFGELKSMAKSTADNPNDMAQLCIRISNDLTELMGVYLNEVEVEVKANPIDLNSARYELEIGIWFDSNGVRENMVRALKIENQRIKNIAEIVSRN